jgi:glycerophosphoryl diester phosphodiesterase
MTFISHRGAAGLKKENSLDAIKAGHSYKPSYVEIDIHHTKDGQFVIYHGSMKAAYLGKNIDETYATLKKRIPEVLTLKEFIQNAPSRAYMLDIKIRTANEDLIKELKGMPASMRAIFTSPHPKTLLALKNAFPTSKTFISQPYQEGPIRPLDLARQYGFDGICLNKWWVGPIVVRACKMSNKQILTYTIDRGITMRIIKKFFPDVTIITNRPDRYRHIFLTRKKLLKK